MPFDVFFKQVSNVLFLSRGKNEKMIFANKVLFSMASRADAALEAGLAASRNHTTIERTPKGGKFRLIGLSQYEKKGKSACTVVSMLLAILHMRGKMPSDRQLKNAVEQGVKLHQEWKQEQKQEHMDAREVATKMNGSFRLRHQCVDLHRKFAFTNGDLQSILKGAANDGDKKRVFVFTAQALTVTIVLMPSKGQFLVLDSHGLKNGTIDISKTYEACFSSVGLLLDFLVRTRFPFTEEPTMQYGDLYEIHE